jgi:CDP-diacylglycerol--glycerol-3-phosphate 3-phosphatidyltransferase
VSINIANFITLSRIGSIPFVFLLWSNGYPKLTLMVFALALLTDFFDGKVARWLNCATALGALLDPVADKITVLTYFSYFFALGMVPNWFFALILCRNVSQLLSIPILVWWLKISFHVKPNFLPKLATAVSFLILWLCFFQVLNGENDFWSHFIFGLMIVSGVMEFYILATYLPRLFQIATRRHDTFE